MVREAISTVESQLLATLRDCPEGTYCAFLHKRIKKKFAMDYSNARLHNSLEHLTHLGLVVSRWGQITSPQGKAKRRRFYQIKGITPSNNSHTPPE